MKEEELKKHIDIIYDRWYETNRFYHIWAKQYGITDLTLFTLGLIYYKRMSAEYGYREIVHTKANKLLSS